MDRKLISFFLVALVLWVLPMTAAAQSFDADRTGSISITLMDQDKQMAISGAELSLYYVATVRLNSQNKLSYTYTGSFEHCGFDLDDPELAAKLDAYVKENPIPSMNFLTDGKGNVAFLDLPLGLYFIKQTNAAPGYAVCSPMLVTVPMAGTDGYVYDVNATPKTQVAKLTDVTIRKVWNTDASTKMADSVTVELLRGEEVVKTAVLHDGNGWKVTFTDLPESDAYSIREVNIPAGFTATYHRAGYYFTVTNTSTLAQTGQLLWPIPVLAFSGMLLLAAGFALLQKKRDDHA